MAARLARLASPGATVEHGKISLTKGTGAQNGHSLVGTFTGTGDPSSTEYQFTFKATYR